MNISPDRIGDFVENRRDWSELNDHLKNLSPGDAFRVEAPPGVTVRTLRSIILTKARRITYPDGWALTTRKVGNAIRCFLGPTSA